MDGVNIIIFAFLLIIASFVTKNLYDSNNKSKLRNVMMFYFATEMFQLTGLLILESFFGEKMLPVTQIVLLVTILPKLGAKIIFYNYIMYKH